MTRDLSGWLITDSARCAHLCDVGAPGFVATVALDGNGHEHLVIAETAKISDPSALIDTECRAAGHEQVGPLPHAYQHRVDQIRVQPRCGRPRKDGMPCRTPVAHHGDHCAAHRASRPTRRTGRQ